jgi:hypothetical protein
MKLLGFYITKHNYQADANYYKTLYLDLYKDYEAKKICIDCGNKLRCANCDGELL